MNKEIVNIMFNKFISGVCKTSGTLFVLGMSYLIYNKLQKVTIKEPESDNLKDELMEILKNENIEHIDEEVIEAIDFVTEEPTRKTSNTSEFKILFNNL